MEQVTFQIRTKDPLTSNGTRMLWQLQQNFKDHLNPNFIFKRNAHSRHQKTHMKPIRDILAKSQQLCIQLSVPQLKALNHFHKPVFDMEKPLVKILARDMDRNGCALEAFRADDLIEF
ncbi:hypothetical protein F8M41_016892 [Gigaspora margarita]|uniref:Uncharacterized protein n=1 Tax=Gigaspora margarita TaxID=4874 RepID=A0A8H4EME7_GIGMA|nr:hypothetical protein F8M41_016892 [Gigaspora margarita]